MQYTLTPVDVQARVFARAMTVLAARGELPDAEASREAVKGLAALYLQVLNLEPWTPLQMVCKLRCLCSAWTLLPPGFVAEPVFLELQQTRRHARQVLSLSGSS